MLQPLAVCRILAYRCSDRFYALALGCPFVLSIRLSAYITNKPCWRMSQSCVPIGLKKPSSRVRALSLISKFTPNAICIRIHEDQLPDSSSNFKYVSETGVVVLNCQLDHNEWSCHVFIPRKILQINDCRMHLMPCGNARMFIL